MQISKRSVSSAIQRHRAEETVKALVVEAMSDLQPSPSQEVATRDSEGNVATERWDRYVEQVMRLEDVGWMQLGIMAFDDGLTLEERQEVAHKTREQTTKSPLLKRAKNYRADTIFGEGIQIEGRRKDGTLPPRFQAIIDDEVNQQALFGHDAQLRGENNLFQDGNHPLFYHTRDEQFEVVSFDQIKNIFYNPDRPSQVWYYLRSYTKTVTGSRTGSRRVTEVNYWVPADTYKPRDGYVDMIADIPVRTDIFCIMVSVNHESSTSPLGLPDALPALPWDYAYAESLRDDVKLRKAISAIAWVIKSKTAKAAARTGAKVADRRGRVGQTAVATEGTELSSMPRAGSIDMTEARPIASMVASSVEISTAVILSDSGVASGSNAAEQTLDPPTLRSMRSRQKLWEGIYRRAFLLMGMSRPQLPSVLFAKLETSPMHREMTALALADEHGALTDEQFVEKSTRLLDIARAEGQEIPEARKQFNENRGKKTASAVPSQGNSGAGSITDDNSARDDDE